MHDPEQDVHLGSPDETHERHGGYEKLDHDCVDVSETRIETNVAAVCCTSQPLKLWQLSIFVLYSETSTLPAISAARTRVLFARYLSRTACFPIPEGIIP